MFFLFLNKQKNPKTETLHRIKIVGFFSFLPGGKAMLWYGWC